MDDRTKTAIIEGMGQACNNLLVLAANGHEAEAHRLLGEIEHRTARLNEIKGVPIAQRSKAGGPCPTLCGPPQFEALDFQTGACPDCS
jgi:hypothetical protein